MVSRDMQTTTAKNLRFIEAESGTDAWTVSPAKLKQELHSRQLVNIPTEDKWRISYMSSLLRQLQEAKHLVQEDKISQLKDLIDSLVCWSHYTGQLIREWKPASTIQLILMNSMTMCSK